jgi:hypothetical protein
VPLHSQSYPELFEEGKVQIKICSTEKEARERNCTAGKWPMSCVSCHCAPSTSLPVCGALLQPRAVTVERCNNEQQNKATDDQGNLDGNKCSKNNTTAMA